MKKAIASLALVAVAAAGLIQAKGHKEEVLMTVNGKPVTLNEFEYLYHKNSSQQLAPQTVDEYLGMFVTYKQKVAAAEEAGIDKTESFQKELEGYRKNLAEPYLVVPEVEDSIINDTYDHMKEEVDVSHIMLSTQTPNADPTALKARLDSIRTEILAGRADFGKMAQQFSTDRHSGVKDGHMGWLGVGFTPYTFENAAYNTPVGQLSEVVHTPYGFHLLRVEGRRPARGQVLVEHILKLTQGLPEAEAAAKKAAIDSISKVLAAGADFEDIARRESEDPGSAANGGRLPWFGTGMMVPQFEQMAFALKDGETSEPFPTNYGYHIIRRLASRGLAPLDSVRPQIKAMINRDERAGMPRKSKIRQLMAKFKAQPDREAIAQVRKEIIAHGGLDSAIIATMLTDDRTMARINGQEIPLSEIVAEKIPASPGDPVELQAGRISQWVNSALEVAVLEAERADLAANNPTYRNLLNEYRDGMLLFEISDRNVWTKAKQDKEGLAKYFADHKSEYTWDKPRYKSFVVFATSDSVANLAKAYLLDNHVAVDKVVETMRKQFPKDVKVEKVIAAQGENPITDYLGFGGKKPEPRGKWRVYFPYLDKILNAPEEPADVRGAVTTDYQNYLEEQWVAELAKRYPAKINKKVLKKAK